MKKAAKGIKRMNINVDRALHDQFKAATAARGENMTDVLLRYIADYVQKNLPRALRESRRK
jgi:ParG